MGDYWEALAAQDPELYRQSTDQPLPSAERLSVVRKDLREASAARRRAVEKILREAEQGAGSPNPATRGQFDKRRRLTATEEQELIAGAIQDVRKEHAGSAAVGPAATTILRKGQRMTQEQKIIKVSGGGVEREISTQSEAVDYINEEADALVEAGVCKSRSEALARVHESHHQVVELSYELPASELDAAGFSTGGEVREEDEGVVAEAKRLQNADPTLSESEAIRKAYDGEAGRQRQTEVRKGMGLTG